MVSNPLPDSKRLKVFRETGWQPTAFRVIYRAMLGASVVLKFVTHSATVLSIAVAHGWLPGARYTNLRDVRRFPQLGFLDIDWRKYDFARHLEITKLTKPVMTVARDLDDQRGALGNVQNPKRLCNYDAKETPRNAKAVSRCIRRAGEASADSGSLSDKRNGATSWRHSGYLHQV